MTTIREIPPTPESKPLIREAGLLIFKHIGQRIEGRSKYNLAVQNSYLVDVEVSRLFIAQDEKAKIIGAATLRLPLARRDHLLEYLAVLPKYREEGVGSQLVETVEEAVLSSGYSRIAVQPLGSIDEFFQSHGYNFERSRHSDLMTKELQS